MIQKYRVCKILKVKVLVMHNGPFLVLFITGLLLLIKSHVNSINKESGSEICNNASYYIN